MQTMLTENALRVLRARYLQKNEQGECIETPSEMFRRVAIAVSNAELLYGASEEERKRWEDRFYNLMTSGRFLPNSPTLMNAGRAMGMLSACFVLPVRDSISDIFDSVKHTAMVQKAGGGTGFAFDELRPTGDYIASSGGTTSGPISFWRVFSEATNAIQQGAFRRGANMGMMYIHHPDILKFLHAKQDLTRFVNYNISVKITDEWMKQFLTDPDSPHVVRNPRTGRNYLLPRTLDVSAYELRELVEVESTDTIVSKASYFNTPRLENGTSNFYTKRQIWDIIIRNAWQTGEPGIAYIDKINERNPVAALGRIEATNPCGEQPLLPYESCNLGSINLGLFVTEDRKVDWSLLQTTIADSVRFLDNIIDINNYPINEIKQATQRTRKIGLGVMGFADALFKLNVPYNSEDGLAWGERFMRFVNDEAHKASEFLAVPRGTFPAWPCSLWHFPRNRKLRNACCTTVAPTGTISIIANCSCGIEPLYALTFTRNVLRDRKEGEASLAEVNQIFSEELRKRGLSDRENVPDDLKRVFVCAHDIAPEWHVKMQAVFQKHCDSSISKTINLPHSATVEDVDRVYRLAFELGCNGVTVYRDGCRDHQPMATVAKDRAHKFTPSELPEITSSVRIRQATPFGNMHVHITTEPDTGRALEVFAQLGKGGDIANSDLEAICRLTSLWLRSGGELQYIVQQLDGIGSSYQIPTKNGRISSLGDGLAKAIKRFVALKEKVGLGRFEEEEPVQEVPHFKLRCPECRANLMPAEGCYSCPSCGWSIC